MLDVKKFIRGTAQVEGMAIVGYPECAYCVFRSYRETIT